MRRFQSAFVLTAETRILDVGGLDWYWRLLPARPQVVILNRRLVDAAGAGDFERVVGDGLQLPFADGAFDVVFSNSVIEHLRTPEAQQEFAREIVRVGKRWFVQTPNRYFPFETHLLTPLIHWLPKSWQRCIVPRWTIWQWVARPRPDQREFYLRHYLEDVRLLGERDLRRLFPQARIARERFCGWTKSLIAVGPHGAAISRDDGRAWTTLSSQGYWAVGVSGRSGWMVGPGGRITRLDLSEGHRPD